MALGLAGLLGLLLLLEVGLTLALAHEPLDPTYAGPRPLPAEVAARFAYPELGTPAPMLAEYEVRAGPLYTSRLVHLLVTTPGEAEPHKVQVIHFQPRGEGGRRPAVVISPIFGGRQDDEPSSRKRGA